MGLPDTGGDGQFARALRFTRVSGRRRADRIGRRDSRLRSGATVDCPGESWTVRDPAAITHVADSNVRARRLGRVRAQAGGPRRGSQPFDEIDLRIGGTYFVVWT